MKSNIWKEVWLYYVLIIVGQALEKSGGKELSQEIKDLQSSQGTLEVANGKMGSRFDNNMKFVFWNLFK